MKACFAWFCFLENYKYKQATKQKTLIEKARFLSICHFFLSLISRPWNGTNVLSALVSSQHSRDRGATQVLLVLLGAGESGRARAAGGCPCGVCPVPAPAATPRAPGTTPAGPGPGAARAGRTASCPATPSPPRAYRPPKPPGHASRRTMMDAAEPHTEPLPPLGSTPRAQLLARHAARRVLIGSLPASLPLAPTASGSGP